MNKRYRIKNSDGRVLGPFTTHELKQYLLNSKDNFVGYQQFPAGEWLEFSLNSKAIKSILDTEFTESEKETFILNLENISNLNSENKIDFKDEDNNIVEEYSYPKELETLEDEPESQESSELIVDKEFEIDMDLNNANESLSSDKNEIDKTKINPEYQEYLKKLKNQKIAEEKLQQKLQEEKNKEIEIIEPEADYVNDATQVVDLKELKSTLDAASAEEKVLQVKSREKRKKIKKIQSKKQENFDEELEDDTFTSKPKILIITVIIVLAYFLINVEEETKPELKKITTISPTITFSSRYATENSQKAKELYTKGIIELKKGYYRNKLKSVSYFVESLREKFSENLSSASLIYIYSDLLSNSRNINRDANTIFKLVKINNDKMYLNPNYASAIAYFYFKINKVETARSILRKYRLIPQNKVTVRLFSVYLEILTSLKLYDEAQAYADKLYALDTKSLQAYKSLYRYFKSIGDTKKQVKIISDADKYYSDSVYFYIERGYLFLKQNELNQVKKIIFKINELNAESSPLYHSKYLALKGLYYAANDKINRAIDDIKNSLVLFENEELMFELASLSSTDNTEANTLIKRSKIEKIMLQVEQSLKEDKLDEALKYTLNAIDIDEESITANLMLAKLQIRKGYLDDAINLLEDINSKVIHKNVSDYKVSLDVKFELVDAYTNAFKVRQANSILKVINNIQLRVSRSENQLERQMFVNDDRFQIAKANIFLKKNDLNSALLWLTKARKINPLNENTLYKFVTIYLRNNEYSKAKVFLNQLMELDPVNVNYRVLNAKILYETESLDTAIGYLYDLLDEFPENPKIYSAIGIYFYQSGKIKNYKNIKEKLLSLQEKDISLFEFLLESARLDEDYNKIIDYSRDIIRLKPGDLARRLYLAEILIELKKYPDAMRELKQIEVRYKNYPRLSFFISKLYYLSGDLEKAIKFAKDEIEKNPTIIDGYLILGDIYTIKKKYNIARKNYLEVARLQPKNVDAMLGIAFIAFKNNQFDMAIDQYNRAKKIAPNRAEIYRLMGNTYRKIEQTQLAIKNYKQFLEISPNSSYKRELEGYIKKLE